MKKRYFVLFLFSLMLASFIVLTGNFASADTLYEKNYTINNLEIGKAPVNFIVRELKYEPYPVTAGEYFDVYIKVQNIGSNDAKDVEFKLIPEEPFSSSDSLIRDYGTIYGATNAYMFSKDYDASQVVLKYRVKTASDSKEGISNLKLEIIPGNIWRANNNQAAKCKPWVSATASWKQPKVEICSNRILVRGFRYGNNSYFGKKEKIWETLILYEIKKHKTKQL